MSKNKIKRNIALFGQMRAGKDTVGDYIIKQHKYMPFKFSYGITRIIEDYLPAEMWENKPRKLYQQVGQFMRGIYSDVWIDKTFKDIKEYRAYNRLLNNERPIIITDCRQENEAKACRDKNYVIIKVVSDIEKRLARMNKEKDNFSAENLQHETEMAVDKIQADYTIENNGTLEELYNKIDIILAELGADSE